jgi:hypothetical protein
MLTKRFGVGLALCVAFAGGTACADAQSAPQAQGPAAGTGDQDQVVATVGDRKFTLKDVEARWQEEDPAERARVSQLLYQHRRQSIDMLVGDFLLEGAAKKAGLTKEKYLETELEKRRGPITDADIQKVFDENRDRVGGSTIADLKDSITKFIGGNRDAQNLAIMVSELKAAGPAVSIALDPPRGGDCRARPVARAGQRAHHHHRVLGVPVPVLRPRHADAQGHRTEVRGQGALRVQGLPAAEPSAGAEGRRSRALRR